MASIDDSAFRQLAEEIDTLRRQVRSLSRGSGAAFRSVEMGDGQPKYYEPTSPSPVAEVVQEDGTIVMQPVTPPPPPVPTQPIVESAIDGINVKWDGTFIGSNRPTTLRYVEIHVSFDPFFTPSDATQVGTMVSAFGGTVFIRRPPEDGPVWVGLTAVDVVSQESAMSSTAEGVPLPAGQAEEPVAPSDAPVVTAVPLGIGGVLASWDPVPDADSYEVYVSTDPIVAFESTELLGEGPATSVAIGMLPNGLNLPYQPIHIRVIPKSEAGPGPASAEVTATPRRATTTDVASEYVYAGQVSAAQVTSGNLNAVVALLGSLTVGAETGRRIVLNPTGGLQVLNSTGEILVNFPTESGTPNVFNGDGVFQGITALGRASFRGNDNEISRNSSFTLASGTTRPSNAPSIGLLEGITAVDMGNGDLYAGPSTQSAHAGWIYQMTNLSGSAGDYLDEASTTMGFSGGGPADRWIRAWEWVDGELGETIAFPLPGTLRTMYQSSSSMLIRIGNYFYYFWEGYHLAEPSWRWYVSTIDATTGAKVGASVALGNYTNLSYASPVEIPQQVVPEGSNYAILSFNTSTTKIVKRIYNSATHALISTVTSPGNFPIRPTRYHGLDTFGKAGNRLAIAVPETSEFLAPEHTRFLDPATLAEYAGESIYDLPLGFLLWHPTEARFYSCLYGVFTQIGDPLILTRLSNNTTEDYVWVAYSWYDDDPGGTGIHETTLSPWAYVQRKKYKALSLQLPVAPADAGDPDSPNAGRWYLYTGAEEPPDEQAFREAVIDTYYQYGFPSPASLDYEVTTVQPPVTNSFPDGNAAVLKSGIGGFEVHGDGTGSWPYLENFINGKLAEADQNIADSQAALAESEALLQQAQNVSTPIGTTQYWPGPVETIPDGWAQQDGAELPIADHGILYNLLTNGGTVFPHGANTNGSGAAGTSHFRLPNVKGRMIMAPDPSQVEFDTVGEKGGNKAHTLTLAQLPNVQGSWSWHGGETGSTAWQPTGVFASSPLNANNYKSAGGALGGASSMGSVVFNLGGGGQSHPILNPYIVQPAIIKVSSGTVQDEEFVTQYPSKRYSMNDTSTYTAWAGAGWPAGMTVVPGMEIVVPAASFDRTFFIDAQCVHGGTHGNRFAVTVNGTDVTDTIASLTSGSSGFYWVTFNKVRVTVPANQAATVQLRTNAMDSTAGSNIVERSLTIDAMPGYGNVHTLGHITTSNDLVIEDPWHIVGDPGEPAFASGYGNASIGMFLGTKLRFRKNQMNQLEIEGTCTGLFNGGVMFTLPVGYRPVQIVTHANIHTGNTGPQLVGIYVKPNGEVLVSRMGGSDPGAYGHGVSCITPLHGGS